MRTPEDANNSYLRTLKASGLWSVLCGDEAYDQLGALSGFDLHGWIRANVAWERDLDGEAVRHLRAQALLTYLDW